LPAGSAEGAANAPAPCGPLSGLVNQVPQNGKRIRIHGADDLQELDHVNPSLTALVLSHKRLGFAQAFRQLLLGEPSFLASLDHDGAKDGMLGRPETFGYAPRVPDEADWNDRYLDAAGATLSSLFVRGVREFAYLYDMGDGWEHRVIVENVKVAEAGVSYPQFLGGERRCPPEDCGGAPGYYEFLKNETSKRKDKRAHALTWYGGPYDADDIGEQKIITAFGRIAKSASQWPRWMSIASALFRAADCRCNTARRLLCSFVNTTKNR